MNKIIVPVILAAAVFMGCTKDDGSRKNCDSCKLQGKKLEICKKQNGTYRLSHDGESETITENQLEGFSPEEFVELLCYANQRVL